MQEMSDFKVKMHKIRFPLGLHPIPLRNLTPLPQTLSCIYGGPTSKGRERRGRGKRGRKAEGK